MNTSQKTLATVVLALSGAIGCHTAEYRLEQNQKYAQEYRDCEKRIQEENAKLGKVDLADVREYLTLFAQAKDVTLSAQEIKNIASVTSTASLVEIHDGYRTSTSNNQAVLTLKSAFKAYATRMELGSENQYAVLADLFEMTASLAGQSTVTATNTDVYQKALDAKKRMLVYKDIYSEIRSIQEDMEKAKENAESAYESASKGVITVEYAEKHGFVKPVNALYAPTATAVNNTAAPAKKQ